MMKIPYSPSARLRGLAVSAALVLVATAAAKSPLFHAELKKSEPADKAVLTTPPTELRLWFSEPPTLALSKVTLMRGSDTVAVGALSRGKAEMDPVVAKISKPAAPGDYVVRWKAMGDDGHVSSGAFGFKVKAATH